MIRFVTNKFDVSKETENPINPIYGESLLNWLQKRLKGKKEITEPDAEDWGWYSFMEWEGRSYMLGSSASEEENGDREWILQIDKQRSFKEKLFGKEKMTESDPCLLFFKSIFENEKEFKEISIE